MEFDELAQIGAAPTAPGEVKASVPWVIFLLVASAICGCATCGIFLAPAGRWTDFTKIEALRDVLLLVLGLSAWLGSYLLFHVAREMARFAREPDFARQRCVAAASCWLWCGIMLVTMAAFALGTSVTFDLMSS